MKISNGARVLMISSDANVLKDGSSVKSRMIEYGDLVKELRIIVFANLRQNYQFQISKNVFVYPTDSRNKLMRIPDAYKIGKMILAGAGDQWLITSQDPFECGLAGWLIKRKFSAPLQMQIHTDFLNSYFKKESFLNRIRVLIARFLIPRADCLRVVSERIKKSLLPVTRYPLRVTVLPIFVDVKKIQEVAIQTDLHKKYPQFDFIILMASRLTKEKNIGLAIEAMADVIKKYSKTGLVVVGEGPEFPNLKVQISNLKTTTQISNLDKQIIFEPWTNDLVSYYKTADLFLLTSNYEGYGRTAIEAMAANCPVIMTNVGLAGDILINGENGLIVPIGHKEELAEAILSLIENPELRNDLAKNAQKIIGFWPTKENYLNSYLNCWLLCKKQ